MEPKPAARFAGKWDRCAGLLRQGQGDGLEGEFEVQTVRVGCRGRDAPGRELKRESIDGKAAGVSPNNHGLFEGHSQTGPFSLEYLDRGGEGRLRRRAFAVRLERERPLGRPLHRGGEGGAVHAAVEGSLEGVDGDLPLPDVLRAEFQVSTWGVEQVGQRRCQLGLRDGAERCSEVVEMDVERSVLLCAVGLEGHVERRPALERLAGQASEPGEVLGVRTEVALCEAGVEINGQRARGLRARHGHAKPRQLHAGRLHGVVGLGYKLVFALDHAHAGGPGRRAGHGFGGQLELDAVDRHGVECERLCLGRHVRLQVRERARYLPLDVHRAGQTMSNHVADQTEIRKRGGHVGLDRGVAEVIGAAHRGTAVLGGDHEVRHPGEPSRDKLPAAPKPHLVAQQQPKRFGYPRRVSEGTVHGQRAGAGRQVALDTGRDLGAAIERETEGPGYGRDVVGRHGSLERAGEGAERGRARDLEAGAASLDGQGVDGDPLVGLGLERKRAVVVVSGKRGERVGRQAGQSQAAAHGQLRQQGLDGRLRCDLDVCGQPLRAASGERRFGDGHRHVQRRLAERAINGGLGFEPALDRYAQQRLENGEVVGPEFERQRGGLCADVEASLASRFGEGRGRGETPDSDGPVRVPFDVEREPIRPTQHGPERSRDETERRAEIASAAQA